VTVRPRHRPLGTPFLSSSSASPCTSLACGSSRSPAREHRDCGTRRDSSSRPGPYRWVRNPIYIAALLIVSGEAWLFLSVDLLLYAGGLAVAFHLLVIGYEEPRLRARFGEEYEAYRRTVSRWIPHPPRVNS
jgi:hypothetical protein